MSNNIKTLNAEREKVQIQENYEDGYWLKKYGVTTEELKNTRVNTGISAKIIEANFKNKAFSL
jgi:hypothetical protein